MHVSSPSMTVDCCKVFGHAEAHCHIIPKAASPPVAAVG